MAIGTKSMAAIFIIVIIGMLIPTVAFSPNERNVQANTLSEGESIEINEYILLNLDSISPSSGNATITVSDIETLESQTYELTEDQTRDFVITDGTVTVTLLSVDDPESDIQVKYDRLYGWDERVKTIMGYTPLFLTALALLILGGYLAVIIE